MDAKKILIKYGGNAMINQKLKSEIANQVLQLTQRGFRVVLVHGGGPFINKALKEADIVSEFYEGQRITTPKAFSFIERTLIGEVNTDLVSAFNAAGLKAVGLSGKDGQLVLARKYWPESNDADGNSGPVDLGQVGKVEKVDPTLLQLLLENGYTPILTCIASNSSGESFNINGDTFAGEIAAALQVDQFIVLTDVDGLFAKYPDPKSIVSSLTLTDLENHYGSTIQGGMIPKIQSCESAVRSGVKKAIILNGTKPEQLTHYLLKNEPIGTTLTT
jgi:acetylglutamate kinase